MNRFKFGDKVLWKYSPRTAVKAKIIRVPDENYSKYIVMPEDALLWNDDKPLHWGYAAEESTLSVVDDPDDWYVAEVERMKNRSPA